jgi:hypothetical protein
MVFTTKLPDVVNVCTLKPAEVVTDPPVAAMFALIFESYTNTFELTNLMLPVVAESSLILRANILSSS